MSGIVIDVEAKIDKAQRDLNTLNNSVKNIEKSTSSVANAFDGLIASVGSLTALGSSLYFMQDIATSYRNMENQIKLVTNSTEAFTKTQEELYNITKETHSELKNSVSIYSTLGKSLSQAGISSERLVSATKTIQQSMSISGASAESANAAIMQLGQGLSSGALRGEELNSVMEQAPRLAQALADELHASLGEMRTLAAEGKLTTNVVFKALENQAGKINDQFSKLKPTLAQGTQALSQSLKNYFYEFDKGLGLTDLMGVRNAKLADKIDEAAKKAFILGNNIAIVALKYKNIFDYAQRPLRLQAEINFEKFKISLEQLGITAAFEHLGKNLEVLLNNIFNGLLDRFQARNKGIGSIISASVLDTFHDAMNLQALEMDSILNKLTRSIFNFVRNINATVTELKLKPLLFIDDLFNNILRGSQNLDFALTAITRFGKDVIHVFFNIYDKVIGNSWWTDTINTVINTSDSLWSNAKNGLTKFSKGVQNIFEGLYNDVVDIVDSFGSFDIKTIKIAIVVSRVEEFGRDIYTSLVSGITKFSKESPMLFQSIAAGLGAILVSMMFPVSRITLALEAALTTSALKSGAIFSESIGKDFLDESLFLSIGKKLGELTGKLVDNFIKQIPNLISALLGVISGFTRGFLEQIPIIGLAFKALFKIGDLTETSGPLGLVGGLLLGTMGLKLLSSIGIFSDQIEGIFVVARRVAMFFAGRGGLMSMLLFGGNRAFFTIGWAGLILDQMGAFDSLFENSGLMHLAIKGGLLAMALFGINGLRAIRAEIIIPILQSFRALITSFSWGTSLLSGLEAAIAGSGRGLLMRFVGMLAAMRRGMTDRLFAMTSGQSIIEALIFGSAGPIGLIGSWYSSIVGFFSRIGGLSIFNGIGPALASVSASMATLRASAGATGILSRFLFGPAGIAVVLAAISMFVSSVNAAEIELGGDKRQKKSWFEELKDSISSFNISKLFTGNPFQPLVDFWNDIDIVNTISQNVGTVISTTTASVGFFLFVFKSQVAQLLSVLFSAVNLSRVAIATSQAVSLIGIAASQIKGFIYSIGAAITSLNYVAMFSSLSGGLATFILSMRGILLSGMGAMAGAMAANLVGGSDWAALGAMIGAMIGLKISEAIGRAILTQAGLIIARAIAVVIGGLIALAIPIGLIGLWLFGDKQDLGKDLDDVIDKVKELMGMGSPTKNLTTGLSKEAQATAEKIGLSITYDLKKINPDLLSKTDKDRLDESIKSLDEVLVNGGKDLEAGIALSGSQLGEIQLKQLRTSNIANKDAAKTTFELKDFADSVLSANTSKPQDRFDVGLNWIKQASLDLKYNIEHAILSAKVKYPVFKSEDPLKNRLMLNNLEESRKYKYTAGAKELTDREFYMGRGIQSLALNGPEGPKIKEQMTLEAAKYTEIIKKLNDESSAYTAADRTMMEEYRNSSMTRMETLLKQQQYFQKESASIAKFNAELGNLASNFNTKNFEFKLDTNKLFAQDQEAYDRLFSLSKEAKKLGEELEKTSDISKRNSIILRIEEIRTVTTRQVEQANNLRNRAQFELKSIGEKAGVKVPSASEYLPTTAAEEFRTRLQSLQARRENIKTKPAAPAMYALGDIPKDSKEYTAYIDDFNKRNEAFKKAEINFKTESDAINTESIKIQNDIIESLKTNSDTKAQFLKDAAESVNIDLLQSISDFGLEQATDAIIKIAAKSNEVSDALANKDWGLAAKLNEEMKSMKLSIDHIDPKPLEDLLSVLNVTASKRDILGFSKTSFDLFKEAGKSVQEFDRAIKAGQDTLSQDSLNDLLSKRLMATEAAFNEMLKYANTTGEKMSQSFADIGVQDVGGLSNVSEGALKRLLSLQTMLAKLKHDAEKPMNLSEYKEYLKNLNLVNAALIKAKSVLATFSEKANTFREIFKVDLTDLDIASMADGLGMRLVEVAQTAKAALESAMKSDGGIFSDSTKQLAENLKDISDIGPYIKFFNDFKNNTEDSLTDGIKTSFEKVKAALPNFGLDFKQFGMLNKADRTTYTKQALESSTLDAIFTLNNLTQDQADIINKLGSGMPFDAMMTDLEKSFSETQTKAFDKFKSTPIDSLNTNLVDLKDTIIADIASRTIKTNEVVKTVEESKPNTNSVLRTDYKPLASFSKDTPDLLNTLVSQTVAKYPTINPNLIKGVIAHESAGRNVPTGILNKEGKPASTAFGVGQFLKGTAADLGIDRTNIESSIMGIGKYLSILGKAFGGNEFKMLAGYAAGEGGAKKGKGQQSAKEVLALVEKIKQDPNIEKQINANLLGTRDVSDTIKAAAANNAKIIVDAVAAPVTYEKPKSGEIDPRAKAEAFYTQKIRGIDKPFDTYKQILEGNQYGRMLSTPKEMLGKSLSPETLGMLSDIQTKFATGINEALLQAQQEFNIALATGTDTTTAQENITKYSEALKSFSDGVAADAKSIELSNMQAFSSANQNDITAFAEKFGGLGSDVSAAMTEMEKKTFNSMLIMKASLNAELIEKKKNSETTTEVARKIADLTDAENELKDKTVEMANAAREAGKTFASSITSSFKDAFKGLLNQNKDQRKSVLGTFGSKLMVDIKDQVVNMFTDSFTNTIGLGKGGVLSKVFNNAGKGISSMFSGIGSGVKNIFTGNMTWDKMTTGISSWWNGMTSSTDISNMSPEEIQMSAAEKFSAAVDKFAGGGGVVGNVAKAATSGGIGDMISSALPWLAGGAGVVGLGALLSGSGKGSWTEGISSLGSNFGAKFGGGTSDNGNPTELLNPVTGAFDKVGSSIADATAGIRQMTSPDTTTALGDVSTKSITQLGQSMQNSLPAAEVTGLWNILLLPITGLFKLISAGITGLMSLFGGNPGDSGAANGTNVSSNNDFVGPVKAATGGKITGAGTGTSDSIPTMLSNGEFIINAKDAKENMALLESVNNGKVIRRAAGGIIGGAIGVGSSVNSMMGGSPDLSKAMNIAGALGNLLNLFKTDPNDKLLAAAEHLEAAATALEAAVAAGGLGGGVGGGANAINSNLTGGIPEGMTNFSRQIGMDNATTQGIADTSGYGATPGLTPLPGAGTMGGGPAPLADKIGLPGEGGGFFGGIMDWFKNLDFSKMFGSLGFATGGQITGTGSATSDSIPAMLSNGEFIVNAAATAKNLPMLHGINNGKVEHHFLGELAGIISIASSGMSVGQQAASLADGGGGGGAGGIMGILSKILGPLFKMIGPLAKIFPAIGNLFGNGGMLGSLFSSSGASPLGAAGDASMGSMFSGSNLGLSFAKNGGLFLAGGGHVSGPGTSTSDSIPAMLSSGEFVVRASAVSQHRDLLHQINSGQVPTFATGGVVDAAAPVMSTPTASNFKSVTTKPGANKGQQVINLNITGDISRQTKSEIYKMMPSIADGVNSQNKETGYKR